MSEPPGTTSGAAVHRQRGAHRRVEGWAQERAARRHRVGARPERARHDQAVAGEAQVELTVHGHLDDHLPRAMARDDEVV
jgi:hypothetical protein